MKSFITAIIITITLVTCSIAYNSHLTNESQELFNTTHAISVFINNDDFNGAEDEIKKLREKVAEFEDFFLATGNHAEIDSIETNMAELESYINSEMKSNALAKVNVLKFLFAHLPESVGLSIANIL